MTVTPVQLLQGYILGLGVKWYLPIDNFCSTTISVCWFHLFKTQFYSCLCNVSFSSSFLCVQNPITVPWHKTQYFSDRVYWSWIIIFFIHIFHTGCPYQGKKYTAAKSNSLPNPMESLTWNSQGCESVCVKKSEIIWNAWKDVLFNALQVCKWGFVKSRKVWNQIKIWTLTSLNSGNTNELNVLNNNVLNKGSYFYRRFW